MKIEQLLTEIKRVTGNFELELDMLRESNNQLVADILRAEQEKLQAEERFESDRVEMKAQAEQDKNCLIVHYEEISKAMQLTVDQKNDEITHLIAKLSIAEETSLQQLENLKKLLEAEKDCYQEEVRTLRSCHEEEINSLHKNYERIVGDKDNAFNAEREQLIAAHHETLEALKLNSESAIQQLQEELRKKVADLESQFDLEKQSLAENHAHQVAAERRLHDEELQALKDQYENVTEGLNKSYKEASAKVSHFLQRIVNCSHFLKN